MGVVLEAGVPHREFQRRLQPFGLALAEVSWQVKMFAHDGVVLAALYLQEPDLVAAFTLWPDPDVARRFFKGRFEIRLRAVRAPDERVRLAVHVNPNMVEDMFVIASSMNGRPCRTSALRAETSFADCLGASFPGARLLWVRSYAWLEASDGLESAGRMRVG